jgi:hypothetical protein
MVQVQYIIQLPVLSLELPLAQCLMKYSLFHTPHLNALYRKHEKYNYNISHKHFTLPHG